jgi:hypothetical protein
MPFVYLPSEDDSDDQVYVYILESLISARADIAQMRLRRGGGIGEVRKKLPLLLAAIRRGGQPDDTCFVVAIDNDRALEHPSHGPQPYSREEPCRHCGLTNAIHAALPDGWPIPGAVAVPVQMVEAWLLLMHDGTKYPAESELPACGRRDQASARRLYGPDPPPQLKDLVEAEWRASGAASREEFALSCILKLVPDDLAARSPSFRRFRDDVARWPAHR